MIVDAIKRCLMIVWNFFFGQISSESIQDGSAKRDEQPAATDSSFGSARDDHQACDDGADDGIDDEDDVDDVEVVFDDDEENENEDEDDREEPVPSGKTDGQPAQKNVESETPGEAPKTPPSPKAADKKAGETPAVAPQRTEDAPEPKKPEATEPPKKPEAPEPPKKPEAPEPPKKPEAPEPPKKSEAPEPPKKSEAPEPPKKSEAPEPPKKSEAPEPPKRPAAEDVKIPEKARAHVKFEDDEPEKKAEADADDPNARFVRSEKGDATKPHPSSAAATVDAFLAGEQKRAVQDNHPQQPAAAHPHEHPPKSIQDQTL